MNNLSGERPTGEQMNQEGGDKESDQPRYRYDAKLANEIEARWQKSWDAWDYYRTPNPGEPDFERVKDRPKRYILDMFPYPSGVGLHVGHPLGYIATDIYARFLRAKGFNVLHTMGFDAFGLPAEQFAVETGTHPRITTERNITTMRQQLRRLGLGHDPHRSVSTTDVDFYRWTQWIFLQIHDSWYDPDASGPMGCGRARPIKELISEFDSGRRSSSHDELNPTGRKWAELTESVQGGIIDSYRLAYLAEVPVNWCPALGTVLANEEVTTEGRSERGNHPVYRRPLKQWMMRITVYGDRLLADLEHLAWPESIKHMQRNWIGRSEGAWVDFPVLGYEASKWRQFSDTRQKQGFPKSLPIESNVVRVFTTRSDTIFGATYIVLAPEHPMVDRLTADCWPDGTPANWRGPDPSAAPLTAVAAYRRFVASRSDVERQKESREKTGVFIGTHAINPATGGRIPIFIADYVLMGYGTGAIMAVPAHDERDFEFAVTFGLPVIEVVHDAFLSAVSAACRLTRGSGATGALVADRIIDLVAAALGNNRCDYDVIWREISNGGQRPEQHKELTDGSAAELKQLLSQRLTDKSVAGNASHCGVIHAIWADELVSLTRNDLDGLLGAAERHELCLRMNRPVCEEGTIVNSRSIERTFDGLSSGAARRAITQWLTERGVGSLAVTYKLRDWLFSRQRYWGEPFPIVYDENGMPHALSQSDLPVTLPELTDFSPSASDDPNAEPEPPLGRVKDWVNVEINGRKYRRETNTMPQWAGSCWYYLRYLDPQNQSAPVAREVERYWMLSGKADRKIGNDETFDPLKHHIGGVDLYVGGVEHAVLHLLYARFWHKVLFDLGYLSTPEPFGRLFSQGYIQAWAYTDRRGVYVPAEQVEERGGKYFHGGEEVARSYGKMGKSLKNAVAPDDIIAEYGCDTLRLYEMAMGPLEMSKPWNPRDIVGSHRFLQRVWRNYVDENTGASLVTDSEAPESIRRTTHRTIAKVDQAMHTLSFNVAVAAMIELNNDLVAGQVRSREIAEAFVKLLAPFAPHIAEELWLRMGHQGGVLKEPFPIADPLLLADNEVEIVVQVLGKVRGKILAPAKADEATVKARALSDGKVSAYLVGKTVRKVIFVQDRLINFVVG